MKVTEEVNKPGNVETRSITVTKKEYSKNPLVSLGLSLVCITSVTSAIPVSTAQASAIIRPNTVGITSSSGNYTSVMGFRGYKTQKGMGAMALSTPKNSKKNNHKVETTSVYKGTIPFVDNYEPDDDVEKVIRLTNLVKSGKSKSTFKGNLPKIKY